MKKPTAIYRNAVFWAIGVTTLLAGIFLCHPDRDYPLIYRLILYFPLVVCICVVNIGIALFIAFITKRLRDGKQIEEIAPTATVPSLTADTPLRTRKKWFYISTWVTICIACVLGPRLLMFFLWLWIACLFRERPLSVSNAWQTSANFMIPAHSTIARDHLSADNHKETTPSHIKKNDPSHTPYFGTGIVRSVRWEYGKPFTVDVDFKQNTPPSGKINYLLIIRNNSAVGKVLNFGYATMNVREGVPQAGDLVIGTQNEEQYKKQ